VGITSSREAATQESPACEYREAEVG